MERKMVVIQMIDSLRPGGAEMVAVNIANELAKRSHIESFLIVSRSGGILENRLNTGVHVFYLEKKKALDLRALWKLARFFSAKKADIVHAHSSSFYFPLFLKFLLGFKLVWHDHSGQGIYNKRKVPVKAFARFFDHSFAVSGQLVEADIRFLKIPAHKISFLPNFSSITWPADYVLPLKMEKGNKENRLVCLANLREEKGHLNLLRAFKEVIKTYDGPCFLYLLGAGRADAFEEEVVTFIRENNLAETVVWLGGQQYPGPFLAQCSIGIIASDWEGFPLALVEYGLSGLAVVSTAVGEIPVILEDGKQALLVPPKDHLALANALISLLENRQLSLQLAGNLQQLVNKNYSAETIITQLLNTYRQVLKKKE